MTFASLVVPASVASGTVADQASSSLAWIGFIFFGLFFYILLAVALWRVFTKAGYAGILSLVPIVNAVILIRIAGMSGWLVLLYLIPIVGAVVALIVAIRLGAAFGKSTVWSVFLLWLFAVIGYFIIGYGDATYTKPVAA